MLNYRRLQMSLGTWDPDSENKTLDTADIDVSQYISLGEETGAEEAAAGLSSDTINSLTPLMKQERSFWHNVASDLSYDDIINLIRFFTLIEEKHSQLYAGDNSPVIGLNQVLKQRKTPLSKEFLQWIKANSSNKFLPNGSLF